MAPPTKFNSIAEKGLEYLQPFDLRIIQRIKACKASDYVTSTVAFASQIWALYPVPMYGPQTFSQKGLEQGSLNIPTFIKL